MHGNITSRDGGKDIRKPSTYRKEKVERGEKKHPTSTKNNKKPCPTPIKMQKDGNSTELGLSPLKE